VISKILNQKKKGELLALHYRCCSGHLVDPGSSHFHHHERPHSHSSGDRHRGRLA